MDELPQQYIKALDNVAILYADEPDEFQQQKAKLDNRHILLGLYEGIPLTQRGAGYTFVLPDKITLFKNAILSISTNSDELFSQIKRTLWHEIAHYYGLSHDDMHRIENS
jgi:predicted Zn-dependent protease with MMP-like domain